MKREKRLREMEANTIHTKPLRINSSTAFATPSSSPVQNTYCAISRAEYCPPLCLNKYSAFCEMNSHLLFCAQRKKWKRVQKITKERK